MRTIPPPKSNPRKANGHRRRQVRARVLAEETHCWYYKCRQPVDKTLPAGHDLAPEVHEIIPVSRGGSPTERANCTLTHRRCNREIGNRTPTELAIESHPRPAIRTSRAW